MNHATARTIHIRSGLTPAKAHLPYGYSIAMPGDGWTYLTWRLGLDIGGRVDLACSLTEQRLPTD